MNHSAKLFFPASAEEIAVCFPVFQALRPHLPDAQTLVKRVQLQMREGYRIVGLRAEDGEVLSVAGYRFGHYLAWGKILYIDDLSTLPTARGQGCAGKLVDWLLEHAREQGCDALHLDSGYTRLDAHRLYLNKGLNLVSHHFAADFS